MTHVPTVASRDLSDVCAFSRDFVRKNLSYTRVRENESAPPIQRPPLSAPRL